MAPQKSTAALQGLEDVGKVILFLLPAMCLVESIDHMTLGFPLVADGLENYSYYKQLLNYVTMDDP